jgi:hypothetical protein
MTKESEREEIKDETHQLQDEEQEELDGIGERERYMSSNLPITCSLKNGAYID